MKNIVFLVDMNSFFVTCELLRHPELKKQALVISGRGKRSVVTAASYAAKNKGIDSAMSLQNALKIDPKLVILDPDFEYYRQKSREIMDFLREFSSNVQPASIDEAYIDVSHYFDTAEKQSRANIQKLATFIQGKLLKQLGFPANIGISTNKFLAKMASELDKPFKVATLYIDEIETKLWPLPIQKMYGIGKKTAEVLRYLNIKTIGSFATFENEKLLTSLLGPSILEQQQYARGIVSYDREQLKEREQRKSISQSRTFAEDEVEEQIIVTKLTSLWDNIVADLEKKQLKIRGLRVFYKQSNFQTVQRSHTFEDYRADYQKIYDYGLKLFLNLWEGEPVRLIGIGVFDFIKQEQHAEQLNIFELNWHEVPKRIQEEKKAVLLETFEKQFNLVTANKLLKKGDKKI